MEEICKIICATCLSKNRRLVPIQQITPILKEIQFIDLPKTMGGVCWECWSILLKYYRFKNRANVVQNLLLRQPEYSSLGTLSTLNTNIKIYYDYQCVHKYNPLTEREEELSVIKEEIIHQIDDDINTSILDQNIILIPEKLENYTGTLEMTENEIIEISENETLEITENETYVIKEEDDLDNEDFKMDFESDNENVYVDTVKTKNNTPEKLETNERDGEENSGEAESECLEKYIKFSLSEEELSAAREDKRNNSNYKKLPFKCDSCVLGFVREEAYNLHMEKKHDERNGNFSCPVCNIRFPYKMTLKRHITKHYTCYKCRLCRYVGHELFAVLKHWRCKHWSYRPDRICCTQCDEVFKTSEDLEQHIQREHILHCNKCGLKFKAKNTLRKHMLRIHSSQRIFTCDICKITFATKMRLESHIVKHNASIAQKLAYCSLCNIQYKDIYVYREHLRSSVNHSERSYSCPVCNKKFASKPYWRKHYNFYHLKKSQYKCDLCNKLFISDWSLKNHKQTQHGLSRPRNHSCNICSKKFYTAATLRSHQLTHSDQRLFMCEDCGDTFKQRAALYTHTKLVHKDGGNK